MEAQYVKINSSVTFGFLFTPIIKKGLFMEDYKFGLEAEYLLLDKKTLNPLWHQELSFKKLYQLIESIPHDGPPSLIGLHPEDAHEKVLPYVVEGYHVKDENNRAISMLSKGVEIRTPVCQSVEQALTSFRKLNSRLKNKLNEHDFIPLALSHHPIHYDFYGERAGRRHDDWKWPLEVMTTYGPDINISFPQPLTEKLFSNKKDFEEKLNYYAPALTALTLNSPFYKGVLKKYQSEHYIKSIRTFRRSTIAPLLEWHQNEDNRIEFKFFEMTDSVEDFESYFSMCLALALEDDFQGRALSQEAIYTMGEVAVLGLQSPYVNVVLEEFFSKSFSTLRRHGFDCISLKRMQKRWKSGKTPADHLIDSYQKNLSLEEIFRDLI
jgi:hypothetical protein